MTDADTALRAGAGGFPTTHWSLVCAARDRSAPDARARLDALIAAYWRPVYIYIRRAWSRSNEDSKDLTQEFLARLADGSLLESYDPGRGRFRAYLKGALKHFLLDVEKSAGRVKRGGGAMLLPLEIEPVDEHATPDELLDRAWAAELVRSAVEELRVRLSREGREAVFRVFEAYELPAPGSEEPSYGEVARTLAMTPGEVKSRLTYARLLLRQILRERVAHTVASEEDLFRELKEIFEE